MRSLRGCAGRTASSLSMLLARCHVWFAREVARSQIEFVIEPPGLSALTTHGNSVRTTARAKSSIKRRSRLAHTGSRWHHMVPIYTLDLASRRGLCGAQAEASCASLAGSLTSQVCCSKPQTWCNVTEAPDRLWVARYHLRAHPECSVFTPTFGWPGP